MPLSNELVLGFPLSAGIARLSTDTGVEIGQAEFSGQLWEVRNAVHEALEPMAAAMQPRLLQIHRTLIERRFGPVTVETPFPGATHHAADTPAGRRTFTPFCLAHYFDPEEAGHEPDDYAIGVALTSRYQPVFVDWRSEHGTSGAIRFDDELAAMVDEARTALAEAWPSFADALVQVIPVWY